MWNRLERYLREISFNIRRGRELDLNRRGFIVSSLSAIGLLFLSSFPFAVRASRTTEEEELKKAVKITGAGELQVGDSKVFHYPDEHSPALLIRTSEREYRSYNIKCTHLQCPVFWDKSEGKLLCPCHNGSFSVEDGSVLAGPPPRPLPRVLIDVRQDGIYAVGLGGVVNGDQRA